MLVLWGSYLTDQNRGPPPVLPTCTTTAQSRRGVRHAPFNVCGNDQNTVASFKPLYSVDRFNQGKSVCVWGVQGFSILAFFFFFKLSFIDLLQPLVYSTILLGSVHICIGGFIAESITFDGKNKMANTTAEPGGPRCRLWDLSGSVGVKRVTNGAPQCRWERSLSILKIEYCWEQIIQNAAWTNTSCGI